MIINASHTNDRIVTADDFQRAREYLEIAEKSMHKTFGGFGENKYGHQTEGVIRYLTSVRKSTRREIMQRFYRDVDPQTMDIIETTLDEMGFIKVTLNPETGIKYYEVTGK